MEIGKCHNDTKLGNLVVSIFCVFLRVTEGY